MRARIAVFGALLTLTAPGGAVAAPPPTAFAGTDAEGNRLAVWTNANGFLVDATYSAQAGAWSRTTIVYAPAPPTCVYDNCYSEVVHPAALSVNEAGTAFLVVSEEVLTRSQRCHAVRTGWGTTTSRSVRLSGAPPDRLACHGGPPDYQTGFRTAIASDDTAALAYVDWFNNHPFVFFGTVDPDNAFSGEVVSEVHARPTDSLQVVIDASDRATAIWRMGRRIPAGVGPRLAFVDFGGGLPSVAGDASPDVGLRRTLGVPTLTAAPDGTQRVVYLGYAIVGDHLVKGTVSQERPGPDTAWTDPVLVP
jgi:hypothetical protein